MDWKRTVRALPTSTRLERSGVMSFTWGAIWCRTQEDEVNEESVEREGETVRGRVTDYNRKPSMLCSGAINIEGATVADPRSNTVHDEPS